MSLCIMIPTSFKYSDQIRIVSQYNQPLEILCALKYQCYCLCYKLIFSILLSISIVQISIQCVLKMKTSSYVQFKVSVQFVFLLTYMKNVFLRYSRLPKFYQIFLVIMNSCIFLFFMHIHPQQCSRQQNYLKERTALSICFM